MNRRHFVLGGAVLVAGGGAAWWDMRRRMGSAADYDAAARALRATLAAQPTLPELIRYATLAPNGHNTQPWSFAVAPGSITLRPDLTRRTPVVDPDDHHLFVSLGCAAENLALAAAAGGHHGEPLFDDSGAGEIGFAHHAGPRAPSALCDAIPRRQSTRADYDGRPVAAADLAALGRAAAVPGVALVLLTDRPHLDRVRDLVVAGNSAQMADPAFVRELKAWLRFNPRAALGHGDGLYSVASGNPALPSWLGPRAFDLFVTAAAQNDQYARQIRSSSGVAVFVGDRADRVHWVQVGRACQRFALQATALGLRTAFINQPVEDAALRPDLARLVGMGGKRPDIVMRFGHGPLLPYSLRRPVAAVMAPH
ncbi:nitroreductase family protein [Sphingomonas sp. RT2P30]|uniref:Acg family FMN-binding oxidoreductase n=1 Tax=Parasphingomonas halimpatiens TaxID=3096162 RepID=UPI002FC5DADC